MSAFSTAATQRSANSSASTTPTLISAKHRNTGATVTPATTLPVHALSRVSRNTIASNVSTYASATPVATPTLRTLLFSDEESMLINQDIVPGHCPHCTSVLQPVYKRLPPEDIVRLKANNELIVVIPAFTEKTDKDVLLGICKYYWLFQRIIDKSNRRINPDDRDWYVKQVIANDHEFR